MNEVQLRPFLLALSASLMCLFVLVIVWPRFFPPPPTPFVEAILTEVRAQNYEIVLSNLTQRWKKQADVRQFVADNLKDDEAAVRMGGFVESSWIDLDKCEVRGAEALVPVYYRMKVVTSDPPRVYVRQALLKLMYEQARWRIDTLRVSKP